MEFTQETFLYFLLRVVLGILFFFQGYDKVFRLKISGVIEFFKTEMYGKGVPNFALVLAAYLTSFIELIGGASLILGIFSNYTMYLLGLDLILVVGAFSILNAMWDMSMVFPRLLLLAILLYLPESANVISFDHLLKLR